MRCLSLLTLLAAGLVVGCGPEINREELGEVHFEVPNVPGSAGVYSLPPDLLPPESAEKSDSVDAKSGDDRAAKQDAAQADDSGETESNNGATEKGESGKGDAEKDAEKQGKSTDRGDKTDATSE